MADRWMFIFTIILFSFSTNACAMNIATVHVIVVRSSGAVVQLDDSGAVVIYPNTAITLRIFGENLGTNPQIAFTKKKAEKYSSCENLGISEPYSTISSQNESNVTAAFNVKLQKSADYYFVCIKNDQEVKWLHQGTSPWVRLGTQTEFPLALWLQIIFIILLLLLSGLFSGLNLGLMSLDKTELKIIERSGSEKEKKYAKVIGPIRARGNFLLCTLLIGNVLVNNCLTILLDKLVKGSGVYAIIGSTAGIVVFGEIIPQALCSRHGLSIGAKTIWLTRLFMGITFVVSWPISKILDLLLGEEIGQVYSRDKLQGLIQVTKDYSQLINEEMNIISGALELSRKTVREIMTKIEDVFMIEYEVILDFDTMSDIMKRGYTRIPVFESEKGHIVAILNTKDLAFVDPSDQIPLKTICKFYNRRVEFVFEDQKLDEILKDFKQGRSHLAIVQRINNEGEGDPFYETVGLVTLEDVIEEIIQSEIVDETDVLTDNRLKLPRTLERQDFSSFNQPDQQQHHVYPQLKLAAFQFLSTIVEPFKPDLISDAVLKKLFTQDIVMEYKYKDGDEMLLYSEGKTCDYFILILQGRVEVTVSKERMIFEGGPFTYFGVQALGGTQETEKRHDGSEIINFKRDQYIPDFTVKALSDLQYIQIACGRYFTARRATLLEKGHYSEMTPEANVATSCDGISRAVLGSSQKSLDSELTNSGDFLTRISRPGVADALRFSGACEDKNTPLRSPQRGIFYSGDILTDSMRRERTGSLIGQKADLSTIDSEQRISSGTLNSIKTDSPMVELRGLDEKDGLLQTDASSDPGVTYRGVKL